MVKLTIIGRIRDGMPLTQGLRYVNEDYNNIPFYKQHAEFILKEISRGSLALNPKMTIRLDHQHSFNCLVDSGVCFITLCDSSYPRTLAFHYLEDLRHELEKFQGDQLVENITRPYSFVKFDSVISSIRKQYVDTRTQANIKKLHANSGQELNIIVESLSTVVKNRKQLDYREKVVMAPQAVSPMWSSRRLKIIALKWTPIGIAITVVVTLLLWASLVMANYVALCS
ncbi:25.3 kDa vesicle transport protein SEC22-1 [Beta vulgaris subsp. vulgaris]|uniref:25.3 kDa vesicle transport protein SEC22-1 n=1 Tax=Beta vulgaris subsp. vulgaris TaxID=3555 RepID=UPI002036E031|nr:25.3 kDa vesicle transport protein SEC22-1 [Beta vulgaris subsp. vulgaris]